MNKLLRYIKMKRFKEFYNKKEILKILRKEFYKGFFDIIPIIEDNKCEYKLFTNLNLLKYKNRIEKILNEYRENSKRYVPKMQIENYDDTFIVPFYKKQTKQSLNMVSICAEEIIQLIHNHKELTILKGSCSKFLCYDIGEFMPANINYTVINNDKIKALIDMIEIYCKFHNLYYKVNFNKNKRKGYIKIENIVTITFDSNLEYIENITHNKLFNILTYPLNVLDRLKTTKK